MYKLEDMREYGVDPIDKWPYNIEIDGVNYETTMPIDANIASILLNRVKSEPVRTEGDAPYCIRLTEYEGGKLHMRAFIKHEMAIVNIKTGQEMKMPTIVESNQYFYRDELPLGRREIKPYMLI